MTNPIIFENEQYEQSFKDIVATASAAPEEGKVLAAHMWEWKRRDMFLPDGSVEYLPFQDVHAKEIAALLGVMADDEGAVYNDSTYGHESRFQRSLGNGAVALSCTGLSSQHPVNLFGYSPSGTGLLCANPVVVAASSADMKSKYKEDMETGKGRLEYIIEGTKHSVDPLDPAIQNAAKRDYIKALQEDDVTTTTENANFFTRNGKEIRPWNEVCVNAALENISAIIIDGPTARSEEEAVLLRHDFEGAEFQKYLFSHQDFADKVKNAFSEYDMVASKMADNDVPNIPTVVIWQPDAEKGEDKLIHFAPTVEHRKMVNKACGKCHAFRVAASSALDNAFSRAP